jgi:hypothetical protein
MPEARIRTEFGDVHFTYNTDEELRTALDSLAGQVAIIAEKSKPLVPKPQRLPKPGYEHAYRFTPDGLVELLIFPKVKTKKVCLALFAYYPDMVDAATIERVTSIQNVQSVVLNQGKNRKYFRRDGDLIGLTPEGISLAQESVPVTAPLTEETDDE